MWANTHEVGSACEMKRICGWELDPVLEGDHLEAVEGLPDLNARRMRDAEVIGLACRNEARRIALEIGTSAGRTTALMALNAPQATVYTVDIPPDDAGPHGKLITHTLPPDQVGRYWRERGLRNVVQVLADTARWDPDFAPIDVAFIDGCHDAEYVYRDSRLVLERARPGTVILWHDFAPELMRQHPWIAQVCEGVERLFCEGRLRGPVLHLRDSWVGLHRVER